MTDTKSVCDLWGKMPCVGAYALAYPMERGFPRPLKIAEIILFFNFPKSLAICGEMVYNIGDYSKLRTDPVKRMKGDRHGPA